MEEAKQLIERVARSRQAIRVVRGAARALQPDELGQRLERIVSTPGCTGIPTTNPKYQATRAGHEPPSPGGRGVHGAGNLSIDDATLEAFLAENDGLRLYSHALQEIRRRKQHFLSTEEEVLLANMSEVARAPQKAFTMLNNADMKFPTVEDENGEPTELTHGRYLRFMRSRNRDVRRAAFKALYGTYDKQKNTICALRCLGEEGRLLRQGASMNRRWSIP